jgi:flagellar basal body-associated protein FliL
MYKDYAFIIMAMVIVWLLLPVKFLLGFCKGGEEMAEDNVTYQDRLPFFTDDYDTQNPLTSKSGRLRMLDAEIERAKDDPDVLAALEERKNSINNMNRAAAMQQYSMQARARQQMMQQQYAVQQAQQNAYA